MKSIQVRYYDLVNEATNLKLLNFMAWEVTIGC